MYQHGRRTKRKTGSKALLQFAFILGLFLVIGALILKNDMANHEVLKVSEPIVSEVASVNTTLADIDEPLFSLKLPEGWSQTDRVQTPAANYYEWRSGRSGGDRMLRLHIDVMPESYKVVRMLPITPDGNRLRSGSLSGNCIDFALGAGSGQRPQGNEAAEAKWGGVSFMCDPINNNQTIGTGVPGGSIAAQVAGSVNAHTFFFYYEDHNIRPDDTILPTVIENFVVK